MLIQNQSASSFTPYLPLIQTLIGGLLTFFGGWLGSYLLQRRQRSSEIESLKSAFYGEISALLHIAKRMQYRETLLEHIETTKQRGVIPHSIFGIARNFFNVYEHNVKNIGILPAPLPEKIVLFYSLTFTIMEEFTAQGKGELSTMGAEDSVPYLQGTLETYDMATNIGHEILSMIKPSGIGSLIAPRSGAA
jgi:hypothetical protein